MSAKTDLSPTRKIQILLVKDYTLRAISLRTQTLDHSITYNISACTYIHTYAFVGIQHLRLLKQLNLPFFNNVNSCGQLTSGGKSKKCTVT